MPGDLLTDDLATLQNRQARLAARLQSPPEQALAAICGDPAPDLDSPAGLRQRLLPGQPLLISHALTGQTLDLKAPALLPGQAQALALQHLQSLVHTVDGQPGGAPDLHRSALAMWRFDPEIKVPALQGVRPLLPADWRLPDHTVWDHQDFSAALAAALVADPTGGPALLAVSLEPVQDFIAAALSTSDLWAGSHLLSRLAWEAMQMVCEELGPEAIVFPRLRGAPQVDLWLRDAGLEARLFAGLEWTVKESDANPLFAAAPPKRFTALVPACLARSLAEKITSAVRQWIAGAAPDDVCRLSQRTGMLYTALGLVFAANFLILLFVWCKVGWHYFGVPGLLVPGITVPVLCVIGLDRLVAMRRRHSLS